MTRHSNLIIICLLLVQFSVHAQIGDWEFPQKLSLRSGDNYQAAFVSSSWGEEVNENLMVWVNRNDQTYTLMYKFPAIIHQEFELITSTQSRLSHPQISEHPYRYHYYLIVWQSNENGNEDLYSGYLKDGELSDIRQITHNPADDINPKLVGSMLVWQSEGKILSSYFDGQWTEPVVVDNNFCESPVLSYSYSEYSLVYEKNDQIYYSFRNRNTGEWVNLRRVSTMGTNSRPAISSKYAEFAMWQMSIEGRTYFAWASFYNNYDYGTFYIGPKTYSPAVFSVGLYKTSNILSGQLFACENDASRRATILAKKHPNSNTFITVSNPLYKARRPVFSRLGYGDFSNGYNTVWLAWEEQINDRWQIFGTYQWFYFSTTEQNHNTHPISFGLSQNYPNPFNPSTEISFTLPNANSVELSVFDLQGREIKTLVEGKQSAGSHQVEWDGRDESGQLVASGVYVYKLQAGKFVQSRKMVLLR